MEGVCACDCPYCGEPIKLCVDASQGAQGDIKDDSLCCRPVRVAPRMENHDDANAVVAREEDA